MDDREEEACGHPRRAERAGRRPPPGRHAGRRRVASPIALALFAVLGAAAPAQALQRCAVTIQATGAQPLGGLQLLVDYVLAPGSFEGAADAVRCEFLAAGAYADANNDAAARELALGFISTIGVSLPAPLWRCDFLATSAPPAPGAFSILVEDAISTTADPVVATASISSIVCASAAVCGNGIVEGDEECDTAGPSAACTAQCRLTRDSQRCTLKFRASGSGSVGGLQFRVDYSQAGGSFEGSGTAVACSMALPSALTAKEDRDAERELRLALVSASGLPLPVDLWECVFTTAGVRLQLQNFAFHSTIATDPLTKPLAVEVAVLAVDCESGPYCGDGNVDPGEQCDDGNENPGDACTPGCRTAFCGDGFTRVGVEQCDDANANNTDCCSNACTFGPATTVCRAAAGVCDFAENCTGTSGACPADLRRTTVCRAAIGSCDVTELCDGLSVVCPADQLRPAGTPCDTDNNACTSDQCNGAGACTHAPVPGPCDDGLFCNGADSCVNGTCSIHAGNPCPGPDGDGNCSESCSEQTDSCTAKDPDGSICSDGNAATTGDQCLDGACVGSTTGATCGDADGNGVVQASDALRALRAAVGEPVSCPMFRCDTDANGILQSSDALRILRKAVGQPVALLCPAA